MLRILLGLIFLFFFLVTQVYAHSGGLDSNGGHYCGKTEGCAGGYKYNEYHCHKAGCVLPSQTSAPTPTPSPTSTPQSISDQSSNNLGISLSEIYPAPATGEKEWVEIYNPNSENLDLAGWKFQDGAGIKKNLEGEISAKSFGFFEYSSGWLNNDGDTLSLLNSAGDIIESYTFTQTPKGIAWAKNNSGNWHQTSTPTKGAENQITKPPEPVSGTSESKKTKTSKSKTPTLKTEPTPTPTQQILGKKSGQVKSLPISNIEQEFATPSVNIATVSPEASPTVEVAESKKSNFGTILLIFAGVVILAAAAFGFFKKWKL